MRLLPPATRVLLPQTTVLCPDQTPQEREEIESYLAVYTALLRAIDPQAQRRWVERCTRYN